MGTAESGSGTFSLKLFGGFELRRHGAVVDVPPTSQRVLAFLALQRRPMTRAYVAASLWPDTTDTKAAANLRTALWRLHRPELDVVAADGTHVALRPEVWVDARYIEESAGRLRRSGAVPPLDAVIGVRGELLPGCWDSWLVFERERLRQECIHLCEQACAGAIRRGDGHGAVLAALAAVENDPLRESANAWLMRAFIATNDRAGAVRQYRAYAALLHDELGLEPSSETDALLPSASPGRSGRA